MLKSYRPEKYCYLILAGILLLIIPSYGCSKTESAEPCIPDFSYTYLDDNNLRFVNESEGEYLRLNWDFGNGRTESTTSKTQNFDVYYPVAGDFDVELELRGQNDEKKSVSKTVTISTTDFEVDFSIHIDSTSPNYVNLENTTEGTFDAVKWLFRNKTIEDETAVTAYFPYAGTFEIELQVEKDGETYSKAQTVSIAQDDPDYFSKLELVWEDEFDGDAVDADNWTFETGDGGWGNNELQNYTAGDNASVANGILTLTAKKLNDNKVAEFTYGRMEIRAKLPSGTGIWPAIWMLGANISSVGWPACGEIDIMEYVGYEPNTVHATVHTSSGYAGNGSTNSKILETAEEEFHVYGLFWTENELIFYTDSIENVTHIYNPANKTDDNWPFSKPQFFILNVAVGGDWGGAQGIDNSIFPQSMEVDYVRVYQEK